MDRRYQVFISSTYTDLVDERREVMQALLELDCLPAGMELFPAANEDQWTLIREVIDQSDYYLVIVGGRYGSTTAEGVSYTEKEYDYAVSKDIPVIGFVHAQPDQIPVGKSDIDPEVRERLSEFRDKVMARMVKKYTTPAELGSAVSRAVTQLIRKHPREGWVRGGQAMTPDTRAEIAELRAALAAFEVAAAEAATEARNRQLNLQYAHGNEIVHVKITFSGDDPKVFARHVSYSGDRDYSWDALIQVLGPYTIDEAPEPRLRELLDDRILEGIYGAKDWPKLSRAQANITDESWGDVLVRLRAIGIIELGTKKRPPSDKAVYWKLTPAGDDYLVGLRAIRHGDIGDD